MSAVWEETPDWSESEAGPSGRGRSRARLRAVPQRKARMARTPFVLVLILVFGLGMAGLLMLNTTLQNQTFESQRLDTEATTLTYQQAALARQLQQVQAPQELARRASALGMRDNTYPAFIRTSDGKIIGYPSVVRGNEAPTQIVKTPEQLKAEAEAAAAKAAAAKAAADQAAQAKAAAAKAAADQAAQQQKSQQQKSQQKTTGQKTTQSTQKSTKTDRNGRN